MNNLKRLYWRKNFWITVLNFKQKFRFYAGLIRVSQRIINKFRKVLEHLVQYCASETWLVKTNFEALVRIFNQVKFSSSFWCLKNNCATRFVASSFWFSWWSIVLDFSLASTIITQLFMEYRFFWNTIKLKNSNV